MTAPRAHLTHTAILVHSVDRVAEFFAKKGFHLNPPEVFENEGTREIYVGDFDRESSKVLLVEPHGLGPYQRPLQKRGPGLHHLGIDVENLVEYCTGLGRVGWLLHSYSLLSASKFQTAYLVRPGVSLMLEVRGARAKKYPPSLLLGLRIPQVAKHRAMVKAIGLENASISASSSGSMILETVRGRLSLKDVLASGKRRRPGIT
jgi:hypothetical protein